MLNLTYWDCAYLIILVNVCLLFYLRFLFKNDIMNYIIKENTDGINWEEVYLLKKASGIAGRTIELTQKAFTGSWYKVFVFDGSKLIGAARAISDGAYQAALYDICVLPEYQDKGTGRILMTKLEENLKGMNIIFYANTSATGFYKKLGYGNLKTGMGKFTDMQKMIDKGFIDLQ